MYFIKNIIKNYNTLGTLTPSSKYLYKKMIKHIDFKRDLHIVEFGAGNGVFSDNLLKELSKNSTLSIFEINNDFLNILNERYKNDKRVKIYPISAENACSIFEKNSIDYVISSLPLAFIEKSCVSKILKGANEILKNDGVFSQFQYFLQNKKQIKNHFGQIGLKFTPINFPPAFVYICNK